MNLIEIVIRLVPYAKRVETAIGPIDSDMGSLIAKVGSIGVGAGGVAAIGLIAVGSFQILTSTGDPEKLINAREMITNALMGLALVILAVFVLRLLGWEILGIDQLSIGSVEFGDFAD